MRHWWSHSLEAAGHVADRPALWLPGALSWTAAVGWIAFLVGVARPPTIAELTFLGAGMFTSGAWPWNAALVGLVLLALALVGFALAATGEAALLAGRRATMREIRRIFVLGLVAAVPVAIGLLAFVAATVVVAPLEFNAPTESIGPLARTAMRLSPILIAILVAMAAGGAVHAAAARHAVRGASVDDAIRSAPRALARSGFAAVLQAAVLLVARVAYLVLAVVLLRVLWAPIGEQLDAAGMDAAVALLLVGFVAIWLCLVLGGGALHAWGSVSWTRLLDPHPDGRPETAVR